MASEIKNKEKAPILLILGIFLLALFVRIWNLSKYPVNLSMDEAAIGHNAYSLLNTAKDEYGEFLPLAFRSAGDYKPPVDFYLTVPSIAIFGLTEFGVRFPVALIGALTAACVIYLIKYLGFSWKGSLFAGFWLSLSPWHIHFSRASFEAVTALFFLILGTTLFLGWVKNKSLKFVLGSAVAFSLSVWAYHAERLFVPIVVVFLLILFKDQLKKIKEIKKQSLIVLAVVLFFAIPFLKLTFFTPAIKERASSTSILRESSLVRSLHSGDYSDISQRIFDNDVYLVYRHWLGKYLNYFDLRFWFWKGMSFTPPGYPDMGLLYAIDLPILLFGIYALTKSKDKKLKGLALFWFLMGPFPASLTMNEQHPLRALTWIPFFAIAMAAGFEYLVKRFNFKKVIVGYGVLVLINFVYFFDIYTNQFPRLFSEYWQYGYKDAAIYLCENQEKYDRIVLSDTFGSNGPLNTGLPYLYVLFYCDWDREHFLETGKHQEKIEFRRPNKQDFTQNRKVLLIGSPWDFLDGLREKGTILKKIDFLNGKEGLLIIEP